MRRLNLKDKRNHKIKSDFGISDYYKYYKQKGGSLAYNKYKQVFLMFNEGLYPILADGYAVTLPRKMGTLQVFKHEAKIEWDEEAGKFKTNRRIDYNETIKLWAEDEEAKKNKVLIRFTNKYIYNLKYLRTKANFKNKFIYLLHANRSLKKAIVHLQDIQRIVMGSSIYIL
jgi:hypothetical protein